MLLVNQLKSISDAEGKIKLVLSYYGCYRLQIEEDELRLKAICRGWSLNIALFIALFEISYAFVLECVNA